MTLPFATILLIVGGTLTGLFAGLLYAFPVGVVPALRTLPGRQHIAAMQALNTLIENPLLFLCFVGPVLLLPLAAFLYQGTPAFAPLVAASLLHTLGAVGVTIGGNIPLNKRLAQVDAHSLSDIEAERIRSEFQGPGTPWMRFHTIRTCAATAATALAFVACFLT